MSGPEALVATACHRSIFPSPTTSKHFHDISDSLLLEDHHANHILIDLNNQTKKRKKKQEHGCPSAVIVHS
jgi:hypothetical protein